MKELVKAAVVLMRRLKPALLWAHLTIGLVCGLVIFYLSFTGLILAFKPQIIELSRWGIGGSPSEAVQAAPLAGLIEIARANQTADLKAVTLWKEKPSYFEMQFGREKKLYSTVDASVVEAGSFWTGFFEVSTNLHRWFSPVNEGDHKIQKAFKGICMILFLLLVTSGIILWAPTMIYKINFRLRNRARNWNLHNVFGFWLSPVIFVIALTGLVMAHQWANNLLFAITGSEIVPPRKTEDRADVKVNPEQLSQMIATAQSKIPEWKSVTARIEKGLVRISIEEIIGAKLYGRSQLHFDAATGTEVFWEAYSSLSLGRKIRASMHPVHTGEAAGFFGQLLVSLGALTSMLLVWTGFAMSYRRFFGNKSLQTSPVESQPKGPIS